MLRLLAQREQGYEDIAALMGLSVDEVRAKVKEALDQLDADPTRRRRGDADAEPSPSPSRRSRTPPPPERRGAGREEAAVPPTPTPASLVASRRGSRCPRTAVAGRSSPAARPSWSHPDRPPRHRDLQRRERLRRRPRSSGEHHDQHHRNRTRPPPRNLTQAILAPVDGGDAAGRALFGRVRKTAVLEVIAKGLAPSPQGQSYTVWLYRSPKVVAADRRGAGRQIRRDRRPVPDPRPAARLRRQRRLRPDRHLAHRRRRLQGRGRAGEKAEPPAALQPAPTSSAARSPARRVKPDVSADQGDQLARVHDPGRVEALLDRAQDLESRSFPPRPPCRGRGRGRPRGGG